MGAQPRHALEHDRVRWAGAGCSNVGAAAALSVPAVSAPAPRRRPLTSAARRPPPAQDGKVLIWTQQDLNGPWQSKVLADFKVAVWRVSWSVFGNILAVSDGNNAVTLWKEATDGARERADGPGECVRVRALDEGLTSFLWFPFCRCSQGSGCRSRDRKPRRLLSLVVACADGEARRSIARAVRDSRSSNKGGRIPAAGGCSSDSLLLSVAPGGGARHAAGAAGDQHDDDWWRSAFRSIEVLHPAQRCCCCWRLGP